MKIGVDKLENILNGTIYKGDLNNLTEGGIYSVNKNDVTNYPADAGTIGNLIVINSPVVIHQILFISNNQMYMRRYYGGSWSVWSKTLLTPID